MQHFEVLDMFLYRKVDCAWFIPSSFGQAYQVAPGRTIRVASILVVLLNVTWTVFLVLWLCFPCYNLILGSMMCLGVSSRQQICYGSYSKTAFPALSDKVLQQFIAQVWVGHRIILI